MALVISSNFYVTNEQQDDNRPFIGYRNLVTPNTVTASSETVANPITNVANPATAWGWVSKVSDEPGSIEYEGTNYMPSPFDPEGWYGETIDTDGTITNVALPNPSGSSVVGLAEQTGTGVFQLSDSPAQSFAINDTAHASILCKNTTGDSSVQFFFNRLTASDRSAVIRVSTGEVIDGAIAAGMNLKYDSLGDGYYLIQVSMDQEVADDINFRFYLRGSDGSTTPPIGQQLYVQAAYFGKADDWPATINESGVKINVNTQGQEVDYIGIAKHNLNQVGLTIKIKYNGVTVVPEQSVSAQQALLFLNNLASPDNIQIIIKGATTPPRIAVLYLGKGVRLERNLYVGHTPINYGRNRTAINGVSENGQYLGEIVVREINETSVNLQNLTPQWYRNQLDPYFALSPRPPCFFAWRPSKYEAEIGYVWVDGNPRIDNQRSNGMMSASWNFRGLA